MNLIKIKFLKKDSFFTAVLGILTVICLLFTAFNNALGLENLEENPRENYGTTSEPYFQTQTIPVSDIVTTITVQNRWNTSLSVDIQAYDNAEVLVTYYISGSTSSIQIPLIPDKDVYLTIRPSSVDGFRAWRNVLNPLVKASGTSSSQASSFVHIPDMSYFTTNSSGTQAGDYFFQNFFNTSPATSLPAGSFDTSNITTAGDYFFANFASSSSLTSLPIDSFDTSSINTAGNGFFYVFAASSSLTSLPVGSFNTSHITTVGDDFFTSFAHSSSLTSLPVGSFNTSSITTVGDGFFANFAQSSSLTSLPVGSFDTSNIITAGDYFFAYFADRGSLTYLPVNTFNTSKITTVDDYFFFHFNSNGKLTFLPVDSFNFDALTSHGDYAFCSFNSSGSLTTLPYNSFNLKNVEISSSDNNSWNNFNYEGLLTKVDFGIDIRNTSNNIQTFYWTESPTTASGNIDINSDSIFTAYAFDSYITDISPKTVQSSQETSITLFGYNLNVSYSFRITSTRFGNSELPITSKTFSEVFPSSSIIAKTYSSATLKIPSTVGWVGSYTVELVLANGNVPTKTFVMYQLFLGAASKITDISKLSSTRQDNIKWLVQTGVTGGCSSASNQYCPNDPVNRGSMAVFLQLLAGYPVGSSNTSTFADVFAGSSKTVTYVSGSKTTKTKVAALTEKRVAAVNWLALTGITGGSGSAKVNGKIVPTYRPQDAVNRGSMATFLLNFSEDIVSTLTSEDETGFADVKIGSGNFTITYKAPKKAEKVAKVTLARATAIRWMHDFGITAGSGTDKKGNLTYRPQDAVNRGAMATFMKNLAVYMGYTS